LNEPVITIVGNLGSDPEMRFTPNGVAVCKFSVAQTPRVKDGTEWKDGEPSWFNCTAWRDLGEHCAESLTRGMQVVLLGRLTMRQYTDREGVKRVSADVEVDAIGPSLRFATAKVSKASASDKSRPSAPSADSQRDEQPTDAPW
jgi:single-strand DNA-binding protein